MRNKHTLLYTMDSCNYDMSVHTCETADKAQAFESTHLEKKKEEK